MTIVAQKLNSEVKIPLGEIKERIETRITQGVFLANMLRVAREEGPRLQDAFATHVEHIATSLDAFLRNNDLVVATPYQPGAYWPKQCGKTFAFVDGGVANVNLPNAAPLGIRVGSYIVRPGDETAAREEFRVEIGIVDDLYSEEGGTYDDRFDDRAKLQDAARIISEAAGCLSLLRRRLDISLALLHGPLVNPVAPYGTPGFPCYTEKAAEALCGEPVPSTGDRHFVPLYRRILEMLKDADASVVGVIERDGGGRPVLERILKEMNSRGDLSTADMNDGLTLLRRYDLSDAQILDIVLRSGEYLRPVVVNRQGKRHKWPEKWEETIETYPPVLTSYLKPSEFVRPFRIEAFETEKHFDDAAALILATSRLLPGYGFPVALDIVDKFAKVPAWLSKQISAGHRGLLLRRALAAENEVVREYAMKMLAVDTRDWFFRPKA